MSNFLARMLDRTLRSSNAVCPLPKPIFANEVPADESYSMTPSSDERNRGLSPKKGESTEHLVTDAFAPDTDLPSVPPATDTTILPDESMHSKRIAESQTVSISDNSIEAEKASGEQRLSSVEEAAPPVSGQPVKPENHDHSGLEKDMQRIVSEQIETSETSGLSEKHNLDSLRSSPKTGAERESALKQKKAVPDSSLNSHISAKGEVPREGGVSDISMLSDKHKGSKTRSYSVKPQSEELLKSFSPVRGSKGADKEDLLISSDFERHSLLEASSGPEQKGPSKEKGISFGKGISSSVPIVKVTIGRIEVRAVTQQASPPRRRTVPAQPRLSLADYLKRRDGGIQ